MRTEAIYVERYCLLVRADHPWAAEPSVAWADAATQPLCLLTADNQNRRIVDRASTKIWIPRLANDESLDMCLDAAR